MVDHTTNPDISHHHCSRNQEGQQRDKLEPREEEGERQLKEDYVVEDPDSGNQKTHHRSYYQR